MAKGLFCKCWHQNYLRAEFVLSFPTVDDIRQELNQLGCGTYLYKIEISCAFRQVKIHPLDYDLLGLFWDATNMDICLPFGQFLCVHKCGRPARAFLNHVLDLLGHNQDNDCISLMPLFHQRTKPGPCVRPLIMDSWREKR